MSQVYDFDSILTIHNNTNNATPPNSPIPTKDIRSKRRNAISSKNVMQTSDNHNADPYAFSLQSDNEYVRDDITLKLKPIKQHQQKQQRKTVNRINKSTTNKTKKQNVKSADNELIDNNDNEYDNQYDVFKPPIAPVKKSIAITHSKQDQTVVDKALDVCYTL